MRADAARRRRISRVADAAELPIRLVRPERDLGDRRQREQQPELQLDGQERREVEQPRARRRADEELERHGVARHVEDERDVRDRLRDHLGRPCAFEHARRSALPPRTRARPRSPPRRRRRRPRRACAPARSRRRSPPRTPGDRRRRRTPPRPERVGSGRARSRARSAGRARARAPRLRLQPVRRDRRSTRLVPPSKSWLAANRRCRISGSSPTLLAFRLVAKGQMGQVSVQLLNSEHGFQAAFGRFSARSLRAVPSTT